jgi:hypothetical protein
MTEWLQNGYELIGSNVDGVDHPLPQNFSGMTVERQDNC